MLKNLKMYYVLVALPYVALLAGSAYFFEPIKRTILNNPIPHLNYAIIFIILTGGIFILLNARRLVHQAGILREFSDALHAKTDSTTLREMANRYTGSLACILQMIAASGDRAISHQEQAALEHELTNARSRLVRRNNLPQYLTGLLVAMGLLGTFIGLLATLSDISVLIGSFADLDMNNIDPIQVFRVMIERMKAPMTSMGIAFSTSMFGLLGSIVIGLMMLGIRRLQGDIFSMLSSEVARHIETALSFESLSFRGGDTSIGCYEEATDVTSKILLRIEERLAETARIRQRALSAEIDDFKKQRAEMLQVLREQTEASNGFRGEMQQLGSQLGRIFDSMEKSNSTISSQISELTVQLAGDAKETQQQLAAQGAEQKKLRETLEGYNIEEWLAETSRLQQRALAAEIEDFKQQREEMLRTLSEQTEASRDFHSELQRLGSQLGSIFDSIEKGNSEISSQISELTVHAGAEAKEGHRLLNVTGNNLRNELQKLGGQLEAVATVTQKGSDEMVKQLSELMTQMTAEAKQAQQQVDSVSDDFREELQRLGQQLGTIFSATEKGSGEIAGQVSELMKQLDAEAKRAQQQIDLVNDNFARELQQLGSQLGALSTATEKGSEEISEQVATLTKQMAADAKASVQRLDGASNALRSELQQLGTQLGAIFNVTEKGNGEIATQISELMVRMAVEAKESEKLESEKLLVNAEE